MVALRDIRRRLKSVQNTKKITYAMKLVSAAKLRRAQESVVNSRAYTAALQNVLAEVLAEGGDAKHPLLDERANVQRVLVVAVGGSRGLCGGYNSNIARRLTALSRELKQANPSVEIEFLPVGKKAVETCRKNSWKMMRLNDGSEGGSGRSLDQLPEDANLWPFDDICFEIEQRYISGEIDKVVLVYTKFKSAISQVVTTETLLPFEGALAPEGQSQAVAGMTIFEPGVAELFGALVPRLVRARVRLACLDAKASEHGSRMTAMDSATRNAGQLSKRLSLEYNRSRQAGITGELLDIIGAAEAVK